jgi:hypothetical protein
MNNFSRLFLFGLLILVSTKVYGDTPDLKWSLSKARSWNQANGWLVGSNFIPSTAVNQLEMWQADTFDPVTIERELGWAHQIGMRTMRVFLHDLVWQEDPDGFRNRIDVFLSLADKYQIKPIFVIFDSCWNPNPKIGKQPDPKPGVHNSQWVQSPGVPALLDPSQQIRLEIYVKGIIGAFANDPRILAWDLWNEPENDNEGTYNDPESKHSRVLELIPLVFDWAREAHPTQPLTSGILGDWKGPTGSNPVQKIQITNSDIITFHNYDEAEDFEIMVKKLLVYHRPILCTEYMARPLESTFEKILPIAKKYDVSILNWGFVAGKTQTYFPWDSWEKPYPPAYQKYGFTIFSMRVLRKGARSTREKFSLLDI